MTRPILNPDDLVTSMEGWDALIRDWLRSIVVTPYPIPEYANLASFPPASSYARCLAVAADTSKGYISNGTVWKEISLL